MSQRAANIEVPYHILYWNYRPLLDNPWHNSAFEGVGFLRLFLPANSRNQDHFTM
jgi:proteasome activator subunit 4